jgi:hypothetical protein
LLATTAKSAAVGTTAAKGGTAIKMLFMTKTTQAIIVAAVTTTAVLTTQTGWHHYRAPASSRMSRRVQVPLTPQRAAQAQQTARDFFEALGKEDWNKVEQFYPSYAPPGHRFNDEFTEQLKSYFGGLEIISLGEPFTKPRIPEFSCPTKSGLRMARQKNTILRCGRTIPNGNGIGTVGCKKTLQTGRIRSASSSAGYVQISASVG